MSITQNMLNAMVKNKIEFVTTVPCKQLSGIIDLLENDERILHVHSNKKDEGMELRTGAYMGRKRLYIIMQNTAIRVTISTLVTLIQYYRIPLPILISYWGEVWEKVQCQVEMAVLTKALLEQLKTQPIIFVNLKMRTNLMVF